MVVMEQDRFHGRHETMTVMEQDRFWFRGVGGVRSRGRMFGR